MKFVDCIEKNLSEGKHVASIFIDVAKAFDSCDHCILIKKLRKIGLGPTSIRLMETYLKDREQIVKVNNYCGGSYKINIGVGQGTVLGPTLFKIYIMDLHTCTQLTTVKFADDTSIIATGKTRDELETRANNEMVKIDDWFKDNKLTLHPGKSRFLVHSRDKLVNLKLGNTAVMRCGYGLQEEGVKLLGVIIDENLDWKLQTKMVTKKISKGSYLLWRHSRKLNTNMKLTIYESFIRCHLLYCLSIWGGKKSQETKNLNRAISRAWNKIGQRKMHTLNRLKMYGLLRLEDEVKIQICKTIWKWDKKKLPKSLNTILQEKTDRLRNRRFVINRLWKMDSIARRLGDMANKQINNITVANSRQGLARKLKKETLLKYRFSCRERNCYICGGA